MKSNLARKVHGRITRDAKREGLSIAGYAASLGVSKSTVSRLKNNDRRDCTLSLALRVGAVKWVN